MTSNADLNYLLVVLAYVGILVAMLGNWAVIPMMILSLVATVVPNRGTCLAISGFWAAALWLWVG